MKTDIHSELLKKLDSTINKAINWSIREQQPEGYWIADAETNCCMEAEWIMAMYFMGIDNDPKLPKVVNAILKEQRQDGSWEIYYKAPTGDINTTVECYTALKIAGLDPESEPLKKARAWILKNGGLKKIRVFTKYWLALLGEWPWEHTPNLPPEIIFLPSWFPLNIYDFASWARATIVPLTLLCSRRPKRPLPPQKRLDELFPEGRANFDFRMPKKGHGLCLESIFLTIDKFLNIYAKFPIKLFRETAIKYCIDWIIKHQDGDGVWGGIQPPLIYSLMALYNEGYLLEHPVIAKGLEAFDTHWSRRKGDTIYINATESLVWDTLLTLLAFLDCEVNPSNNEPMKKALNWLLGKFVDKPGDWQIKVKDVEPGAWAFERANTWYPDVDDTAVALIVLAKMKEFFPNNKELLYKLERALKWTIAMQSSNGGWGAFDKDNTSIIVTKIPFCDFGEALDPPTADVTGHCLEALGLLGMTSNNKVVCRALSYIKNEQELDGSWFGRWGVNYIYGTGAVLPGLKAIGEDMNKDYIKRAAQWIVDHQNSDGGWGESCASYMDDNFRGKGPSTPSQTAWALMALIATGSSAYLNAIKRGLSYLIERQNDQGTWHEPWYTGTGFPGYGVGDRVDLSEWADKLDQGAELSRGFMVKYNMYCHYFPLMALGRARTFLRGLKK